MKLIMCAGMPRAGSTVQYRIVEQIVHLVEPGAPSREGFRKGGPLLKQERPGYAVIRLPRFWSKALAFRPKVITSCCDPRHFVAERVAVAKPFEQVLEELALYIDAFEQWSAVPGALAMRYEALIRDLTRTVLYIARWLEIPVTKEQAQTIAVGSGFSNRRKVHAWQEVLSKDQQSTIVGGHKEFMLRAKYLKEGE